MQIWAVEWLMCWSCSVPNYFPFVLASLIASPASVSCAARTHVVSSKVPVFNCQHMRKRESWLLLGQRGITAFYRPTGSQHSHVLRAAELGHSSRSDEGEFVIRGYLTFPFQQDHHQHCSHRFSSKNLNLIGELTWHLPRTELVFLPTWLHYM